MSGLEGREEPFFVVGTQRAGTTLLTRILSSHQEVFVQNEANVHKIFSIDGGPQEIVSTAKKIIGDNLGGDFDEWMRSEGKSIWGFKDPELTQYLSVLEKFTGLSKFVIIVRDGRGVVNSYMHNKWGLGTTAYTGAQRWVSEVEAQLRFMEKYPDVCLLVRYEDLVINPSDVVQRVCEHLGLYFDPGMLEYFNKKSYISSQRESENVNRSLDVSLSEKWKLELSKKEIQVINHVAGKLLERLGYSLEDGVYNPTGLETAFYRLHQKVIGEIQLQYRWRSSVLKRRYKRMLKRL